MKRRDLLGALALAPVTALAQALPPPRHGLPGVVRIFGTPGMAPVVAAWIRGFSAHYPDLRVVAGLTGSDTAMAGLYTATCDIALLGREATKPEIQAFEWIHRFRPKGVPILTGSVRTPGASPAIAVMVHPSNPLHQLSLIQLRSAFGDEAPRARTWGDLGLTGEWKDRPINLYSPDAESGTGRFFRARVLGDSNRMAWSRMREFPVPPKPIGAEAKVARALRRALARDPFGLGIGIASEDSAVRVVPLTGKDGAVYALDEQSVSSNGFPLTRSVHAYFVPPPAGVPDSVAGKFLRHALSAQGQTAAEAASDYFALTPDEATRSRGALG